MAKTAKKAKAKAEATEEKVEKKAKGKSSASEEIKYGVAYLAEQLGLEPFTIRQKLRKAQVEKNGRSYSWATKKEADEVVKTLKSVKLKNEE